MMLSSCSKQYDSECSETSWLMNGSNNIIGDIRLTRQEEDTSEELDDIVLVDSNNNNNVI